MNKLLIIDGNSLLFRAYYATSYGVMMKTKSGIPTNAIFAFANMFNKAIELIKPTHCVVAFDKGKQTFRHDLFEDYKAGRKETPEELVYQFQLVRDYLSSYNIPYLELDKIEADDIVGTLSKQFSETLVCILSSDRDLLQLIDNSTSVFLMKKGLSEIAKMDIQALWEQLEIKPEQITDLKGLMGDASDNIPGVKGIGEKTALKLLKTYSTLENIYENIEHITGKTQSMLSEQKASAFLSKQLATIKVDVELNATLEQFIFKPSFEGVYNFYTQYEMHSLATKAKGLFKVVDKDRKDFKSVKHVDASFLVEDCVLYFDTNEFDYFKSELLGISLFANDSVCYIETKDLLKDDDLLMYFKSKKRKVVYDLKRIYHLFDYLGLEVNDCFYDLRLACFLYDSNLMNYEHLISTFDLSNQYRIEEVFGTVSKPKMIEFDLMINHAIEKVQNYQLVFKEVAPAIIDYGLSSLFFDVEMPLSKILFKMEKEGICTSLATLDDIAVKTSLILEQLTQRIYGYVKSEFNINSPKQLANVLFDELGLPANKKRSTSVEILEKIELGHPIVSDILKYRKYSKIYSTYAEGLKRYVGDDQKVHTIFNQCATLTGRLSSIEPNLQNISIRDEEAKEIRKAFVASEGRVLLACDYSQVELRMLADIANEQGLIDAFTHNIDIHTKTASDIFNVPLDCVDDQLRRKAKAVNFGIVYGISDFGLANQVNSSVKEAKLFIDQYFISYPNIKKYMVDIVDKCSRDGYVTTILNRRRYIREIHEKNFMVKEFGKRAAMNSPIQGSAADLIKVAMVHIDSMINEAGMRSKMILQVHDELIFDVYEDELEQMKTLVLKGMGEAMTLKVPLVASAAVGKSWYDAK